MAHPLNHFILQFSSHRSEVRIVAGYSDQQMAVVCRIFLGIAQHVRIQHINLQRAAAVFAVAPQKGLEFFSMLGIFYN